MGMEWNDHRCDELDEDEMEKIFQQCKNSIDNATLGGVRLVSYIDNR